MSAGATALLVIGTLLVVLGVALLVLDALGTGDTSGLDYKDVAILLAGVVLAGIGAGLPRRRKPVPNPPPAPAA